MIELELEVVHDVLARIQSGVEAGSLWAVPCGDVAAWMITHAESFAGPPTLDDTSWTAPA